MPSWTLFVTGEHFARIRSQQGKIGQFSFVVESCYRWELVKKLLPADNVGFHVVVLLPSVLQLGQAMSANTTMHQPVHTHRATTGAADLAAGSLLGMATSARPPAPSSLRK